MLKLRLISLLSEQEKSLGGDFVPLINVSFADSAKETRPVNT